MLGEGGGLCNVSCTVEVGGSASQWCVGGSLDGVVVGVVVGWVVGGVTPGGEGNMWVAEVFVVGVDGGRYCRSGLVSLLKPGPGRL